MPRVASPSRWAVDPVPAGAEKPAGYPCGHRAAIKRKGEHGNDYSLSIPSGTACFEIETQPAEGDATSNDTRIWTNNGSFKSLDDDSGPGWYSKARAFLSGNAKVVLWFAAYSSQHNTMKFESRIRRLNLAEADCTTGQSLPWIKKVNSTTTYSANAN